MCLSAPDFVLRDELSNSLCTHVFKREVPTDPHLLLCPTAWMSGADICEVQPWNKLWFNHFIKQIAYMRPRKTQRSQNLQHCCLLSWQRKRPTLQTSLGMANLDTKRKRQTLEWRKSHICITPSVQLWWNSCRKPAMGIKNQMQSSTETQLNTDLQQKLLHKWHLLMFCCIYSFNIVKLQSELPLGRKHKSGH